MKWHKGQKVLVSGDVIPSYRESFTGKGKYFYKGLIKLNKVPSHRNVFWGEVKPYEAIIIGLTVKQAGDVTWDPMEPTLFSANAQIQVFVVQPLSHGIRYVQNRFCLESDMEAL